MKVSVSKKGSKRFRIPAEKQVQSRPKKRAKLGSKMAPSESEAGKPPSPVATATLSCSVYIREVKVMYNENMPFKKR